MCVLRCLVHGVDSHDSIGRAPYCTGHLNPAPVWSYKPVPSIQLPAQKVWGFVCFCLSIMPFLLYALQCTVINTVQCNNMHTFLFKAVFSAIWMCDTRYFFYPVRADVEGCISIRKGICFGFCYFCHSSLNQCIIQPHRHHMSRLTATIQWNIQLKVRLEIMLVRPADQIRVSPRCWRAHDHATDVAVHNNWWQRWDP